MALIVEDGTGKPGANSYADVAGARAYASDRGLTLPADDAVLTALLVRAMDYLEQEVAGPFVGSPTFPGDGHLKWPRSGVRLYGADLDPNTIPQNLVRAQCQLAIELQTVDPTKSTSGEVVKVRKFDAIQTEYAADFRTGPRIATMPKVAYLLQPLLRAGGRLSVGRA